MRKYIAKQNRFVIILAGGIGARLGGDINKQFVEIKDRPIIVHTLDKYLETFPLDKIILVLNPAHILIWQGIVGRFPYLKDIRTVAGGKQRYHSVKNALKVIGAAEDDLIGVHDAVRPFVSQETIDLAYLTAQKFGTGVPIFNSVNTLRVINGKKNKAIDRALIKEVQNPQVFTAKILNHAYNQRYRKDLLDDATAVEATGVKIHLCEGNYENIKITHPQDLYIAKGIYEMINNKAERIEVFVVK